MTGYGRGTSQLSKKKIVIEVKSLNGKQLDINLRIPAFLREKEAEIRTMLAAAIERGKVDFILSTESTSNDLPQGFNTDLISTYYQNLSRLADQLGAKDNNLLSVVMQFPDVMNQSACELSDSEWKDLYDEIALVLKQFDEFRLHEGGLLQQDFEQRIHQIIRLLDKIEPFEQQRIVNIREKMSQSFDEHLKGGNVDQNRFEQEMIYYLERLDVTEEKVRLRKHCEYFMATLSEPKSSGKKLGFISQEIGREINTLGSKANDADMQTLVVEMKDELEKIKEQLANIL